MGGRKTVLLGCVLVSVLLAGCASMTIEQEIHPDGTQDVAIEASADSELVLNMLEEEIEQGLATENAVMEEGTNSFTYRFEGVVPHEEELPEDGFEDIGDDVGDDLGEDVAEDGLVSFEREPGLFYTTFRLEMESEGFADTEDVNGETDEFGWEEDIEEMMSSMSVNHDIKHFGTLVDTNGQQMADGAVRFDLTEEEDYYLEFRAFRPSLFIENLRSDGGCAPDWECSDWGACEGFEEERTCTVQNDCGNYMFEPQEARACQDPSIGDVAASETELGSQVVSVEFDRPGFGDLLLIDEDDEMVGSTYVSKDEDTTTHDIRLNQFIDGGTYYVVLEDGGDEVYRESVEFDGPELEITDVTVDYGWEDWRGEYSIEQVEATVSNTGDLPAEAELSYTIGNEERSLGRGDIVTAEDELQFTDSFPNIYLPDTGYSVEVSLEMGADTIDTVTEVIGDDTGDSTETDTEFEAVFETPGGVEYTYDERAKFHYIARDIAHDNWGEMSVTYLITSPNGETVHRDSYVTDEIYTQGGSILGDADQTIGNDWETGEYTFEIEITDLKTDKTDTDKITFHVTSDSDVTPKIVLHAREEYTEGLNIELPVALYGFTHNGYYDLDVHETIHNLDETAVWSEYGYNTQDAGSGRLLGDVDFSTGDTGTGNFELEYEITDNIAEETYVETAEFTVE